MAPRSVRLYMQRKPVTSPTLSYNLVRHPSRSFHVMNYRITGYPTKVNETEK